MWYILDPLHCSVICFQETDLTVSNNTVVECLCNPNLLGCKITKKNFYMLLHLILLLYHFQNIQLEWHCIA